MGEEEGASVTKLRPLGQDTKHVRGKGESKKDTGDFVSFGLDHVKHFTV